jgi:hypothetical protein
MAFTPSSAEPEPPLIPEPTAESRGDAADGAGAEAIATPELIEQLQADRLWLLRQIDAGAYPELRLDLAALERELGQLLDQASETIAGP